MLATIQNCSFLLANGAPVPALMRFILHRPLPLVCVGSFRLCGTAGRSRGGSGSRGHGGTGAGGREGGGDTMGGGGVWSPGRESKNYIRLLGHFGPQRNCTPTGFRVKGLRV